MKAIIPVAGGAAKLLRPHTYTQPKALIPIAGKTILSFIVDQLQEGGIKEFVFILGYLGEKIQSYITSTYPHLKCHFVTQSDRRGTGHAIKLAYDFVGNDKLMVVLGDTICDFDIKQVIAEPYNMLGIKRVDDPRHFGVAKINEKGLVEAVVEKPSIPVSNFALVGVYKIIDTTLLHECLLQTFAQSPLAEAEWALTDALQCMIAKGASFKAFKVDNWYDCGKVETVLEANAILLKKHGGNLSASNHLFDNTIIVPPVSIGTGCKIGHSVIGPNVSIGNNTVVSKSIIRDSIIGTYSKLEEVVLDNSLIGSDAVVKGLSRKLNIGDNTEIDFG